MAYATKIHRTRKSMTVEAGGEIDVKAGGTLRLQAGATVVGLPDAAPDEKGVAKQAAAVADAAGDAPTAAEFNALLAALRTAGIVAAE